MNARTASDVLRVLLKETKSREVSLLSSAAASREQSNDLTEADFRHSSSLTTRNTGIRRLLMTMGSEPKMLTSA